jgi:hypothetical protein
VPCKDPALFTLIAKQDSVEVVGQSDIGGKVQLGTVACRRNNDSNSVISIGSASSNAASLSMEFRNRDGETLVDDCSHEVYTMHKSVSEPCLQGNTSTVLNTYTSNTSHTLLSNTPVKKKSTTSKGGDVIDGGSSVFTCLGDSSGPAGRGIPATVMRRNNRKPHMKRINPTFIRKLSPPNDASSGPAFG